MPDLLNVLDHFVDGNVHAWDDRLTNGDCVAKFIINIWIGIRDIRYKDRCFGDLAPD